MSEEPQLQKRGRPKKIKTQEEIELDNEKKREQHKKYYEKHKKNIDEQHKKYCIEHKDELSKKNKTYYQENKEHIHLKHYQENRDELRIKSKSLQSKYRQGYRFLCKLFEDNIIPETYENFVSIKNIL